MRLWVWRHFRIELPDDWEMLQFSRDLAAGRCAFADRYEFRLELSWQAAEAPPDMDRLVSDYLARLRLEGTMPDAARSDVSGWLGIRGHQGDMAVARFARHFAAQRCLLEVVLLWPESPDEDLEREILDSIAPEPERPDGLRRWRAFGLDALASAGLALHECVVEPAKAVMVFTGERFGLRETYHRLGMVAEWLKGSVRDWLAGQTPPEVTQDAQAASTLDGHAIETVSGTRRAGLATRKAPYVAAAWVCPADGRLYCATATGQSISATDLAGRRLVCCDELRRSK